MNIDNKKVLDQYQFKTRIISIVSKPIKIVVVVIVIVVVVFVQKRRSKKCFFPKK